MGARVLDAVRERLAAKAIAVADSFGTLAITLPRDEIPAAVRLLKEQLGFDLFLDVTAVDWPQREERFEVVYHFYSTRDFVRVRLKTSVREDDCAVDSLCELYGSARYMERECHEMYGIGFRGNADLRPLLLYEGFVGHPLRKDYDKEHEQPLVPYRQ